MAITETLNVTSSTTSLTTSVGATDRELVKLYHVVASPASISLISSSLYTITGYSDTSQALSIVFDDWTDYVGDSILVVIYTDIDTGNVADSMLTAFGTAANISPTTLQNELAHLYYIIGQITGGASVADASLADLSDAIARINNLAGKVFASTATAGLPALWDGTDTLSIGGEDSVEEILTTHESRLDTAESDVDTLQATSTTHTLQLSASSGSGLLTEIQNLAAIIGAPVGLPGVTPSSGANGATAGVDAASIYFLGTSMGGVLTWYDLVNNVQALIAAAAASGAYARWAGGIRIQGGASRGDIYTTGTPVFREGNFINGNTPTATEFASYYAGGTELHIYPPTGTDNTDYVMTIFDYNNATGEIQGSSVSMQWVTDHWVYQSTDAPLAIYFLRVT